MYFSFEAYTKTTRLSQSRTIKLLTLFLSFLTYNKEDPIYLTSSKTSSQSIRLNYLSLFIARRYFIVFSLFFLFSSVSFIIFRPFRIALYSLYLGYLKRKYFIVFFFSLYSYRAFILGTLALFRKTFRSIFSVLSYIRIKLNSLSLFL